MKADGWVMMMCLLRCHTRH